MESGYFRSSRTCLQMVCELYQKELRQRLGGYGCHLWKWEAGDKGICLQEKILHLGYATFEMFVRNLKGEVKTVRLPFEYVC